MPRKDIHKDGVKTQFGEGQDPTKGGAPKGKRVSTILKEILDSDLSEHGIITKNEGIEGNKALALELIGIAFHKDSSHRDKLAAIAQILDRLEGKANQSISVDTVNAPFKPIDISVKKDDSTEEDS